MCAVHGRRPGFDAATRAGWTGLDDGRRGCPATGARRARSDGWTRARGCPGKEARWGWQGRDGRARAGASQRPGRAQGHGTTTMGRHVSIQCAGFVVRRSRFAVRGSSFAGRSFSIHSQGRDSQGTARALSETGSRPLPLRSRRYIGFHARVLVTAKGAFTKTGNERRRSARAVGGWGLI